MANHKWDSDECIHCGLMRDWKTYKTRMAMVGNRDVYKYERLRIYMTPEKKYSVRPNCPRKPFLSYMTTIEQKKQEKVTAEKCQHDYVFVGTVGDAICSKCNEWQNIN